MYRQNCLVIGSEDGGRKDWRTGSTDVIGRHPSTSGPYTWIIKIFRIMYSMYSKEYTGGGGKDIGQEDCTQGGVERL